jgi:hypothetical protein
LLKRAAGKLLKRAAESLSQEISFRARTIKETAHAL